MNAELHPGPWLVEGGYNNSPILPHNKWGDHKVTPLHFLGVIAGCAAGGLAIGYGVSAFVATVIAKRAEKAIADLFNTPE